MRCWLFSAAWFDREEIHNPGVAGVLKGIMLRALLILIPLLLAADKAPVDCGPDRVCAAWNELAGVAKEWAQVRVKSQPGTLNAVEVYRWKEVEKAWGRVRDAVRREYSGIK